MLHWCYDYEGYLDNVLLFKGSPAPKKFENPCCSETEWLFIGLSVHWPLSSSNGVFWQCVIFNNLCLHLSHAVILRQIYPFHYRIQSLLISSPFYTHSLLFLIISLSYFIPPLCSCCRTPRRPRARWWFWSAGSVEALLRRSDGTAMERRSWTPPIFVFSRKVRHSSSSSSVMKPFVQQLNICW